MRTKKNIEENLELRYTGSLDGAKAIYLHYGYGENWDNITECKMRKLKNCYKAEVTVPTGTELRFCFRDGEGNWDNNYGNDYTYISSSSTNSNSISSSPYYSAVEVSSYTPKNI